MQMRYASHKAICARVQKGIPRVYCVQTFHVDAAAAILYARARAAFL